MYQNSYGYPNVYHNQYLDYHYNRTPEFANKIGQFFTIPHPVTLSTGYTIPANTRIFIHNVSITSTGEELVTIVVSILKGGSWVSETIRDIPAKQLS
ncbi:NADH:ubiquinone oxidoreductase [Paenibacillus sp. SYP-B3998]|uniref:NADH:ubiquinone oxidoreductase n=1 Tax=Paenibacillus sp. SYP-B3998 TaxID=2678564 RepID=A0A6G4A7C7_9BACL|nr:NADH:ubiquinone oxidoreductase [Paenibacillus sp. SYP-B3998]NEW09721.1 NADH:ubiquinone oxidoreductase [Paenibacillus sp. SYP-B3998]